MNNWTANINIVWEYFRDLILNLTFTDLTPEQVTNFLREHPDFLERHVMEETELEQLERWMIRKTQRAKKTPQTLGKDGRKTSLSR